MLYEDDAVYVIISFDDREKKYNRVGKKERYVCGKVRRIDGGGRRYERWFVDVVSIYGLDVKSLTSFR